MTGKAALPPLVRPMLATLGELPTKGEDDDFAYETKFDGVRIVASLANGKLRLTTRNDNDVTTTYPELADLAAAAGPLTMVLDGEVVAFAPGTDRSSFEALQPRIHLRDKAAITRLAHSVPVTYYLFDVLFLDGKSTVDLPYEQRRSLLEELRLEGPHWSIASCRRGGGREALAVSKRRGEEGILAKRLGSVYRPGQRSRDWIKVKNVRTQEVVVGGWSPGKGARADTIGALLVGVPDGSGLIYAGKVGTGFSQQTLADLSATVARLSQQTSPFQGEVPRADARDAHWVQPSLVGEVEFGEWTRDGRLRHPRWRGVRPDKKPAQVVRESG